jgi:S-adenosylmethionine-diacylglycerol 3-amino-3-carboxypropyl transferase
VKPQPTTLDRVHQRFFNAIYDRSLLYNACWEDPALDRVALQLGADDAVLVITSAGCNALDYALQAPRVVHAVDANPRRTALLELKIAGIRRLCHEDFFKLFGRGAARDFEQMYFDSLRRDLSPFAQGFWDERTHWFSGCGWRRSFYDCGLSGLVARACWGMVDCQPALRGSIERLLNATSLAEQQEIYDRDMEPRLWTKGMNWAVSRRATMSLLGVPYPQARAVESSHSQGIAGFIQACIRYVFRQLPIWTNYFWTVYLRGAYSRTCCPEYLKPEQFAALKGGLVDRIAPHTTTVTRFLESGAEPISRFVLLDHMDWMSYYYPDALAEEWSALLRRASPGARVLFRSASEHPGFLDQLAVAHPHRPGQRLNLPDALRFDRGLADRLHQLDRVHTYASFHVAEVAVP